MKKTSQLVAFIRRAVAIALVLAVSPAVAVAARPGDKLDTALRQRATRLDGRSRVIVEFASDVDVRVFGRGVVGRKLGARAQVGEIDNNRLITVAGDARVKRIIVDRPVVPTLERTGAAIGATVAREEFGLSGRGVGVAVIDSGITSYHDDLYDSHRRRGNSSIVHFKDFTRPSNGNIVMTEQPSDDYGHGTHVAGIVSGSGADSDGRRAGIAPGANLIGLRVLDGNGHGYISDVIAAIDYAISIRSTYNVRIINLSVASAAVESYHTDPLTLAAKRATDVGIVVIASAGNLGRSASGGTQFGGITSPGNAPWVLTVGASSHGGTAARSDDAVAEFSSRGPTWIDFAAKPDVLAPGVGIESLSDPHSTLSAVLSAYLLDGTRETPFKPYLSMSGTSMAAPVVTGTVALMLEANPRLTPNAVKAILQYTAQELDGTSPLVQGAGLLNAKGALRLARFFGRPALGIGTPSDEIAGEGIRWARHILWGNYLVTGGVLLPGSNAWSLGVTWGDFTTGNDESVVWGTSDDHNIVWSTGDDENIVWSTGDDENIVWSTSDDGNIVWSTGDDQNIVWSTGGADENIVWSTSDDGNIVWSTRDDNNIVWSTARNVDDGNIVWSTAVRSDDGNIVWSTAVVRNVVWDTDCGGRNCRNVKWGARSGNKVWGTADDANIVWSTGQTDENIVWSTRAWDDGNIVWSTGDDGNIVWSTGDDENIVWSTNDDGNIVWSTNDDGNIVWSTSDDGNIVWSTWGDENIVWSTGDDSNIVWSTRTADDGNIVWSTAARDQVVWPAAVR